MLVDSDKAKNWYEMHGISNDDWDSYDKMTQNMLRLEATLDTWSEIDGMRETGIPPSAVLAYIDPESIGIEHSELEFYNGDDSVTDVSTYVVQNATRNIKRLFINDSTNVLSVAYTGDHIRIEVEVTPKGGKS